MGHVRIGFLPHTRQWNSIVAQLGSYDNNAAEVAVIADYTLTAVRKEYEELPYDESVIKAIEYLADIIVSSRKEDQAEFLQRNGYAIDDDLSLFAITSSAHKFIRKRLMTDRQKGM